MSWDSEGAGVRAAAARAFSETSDPAAYVPREATTKALGTLQSWATSRSPTTPIAALIGSPGLGKTMLLRVLETRLAPRALYLPYGGLAPVDLAHWVHGLLARADTPRMIDPAALATEDEEAEARGAIETLFALGTARSPFFLLIDDADSMPAETVRALVASLPRSGSPLRVLLALHRDAKGSRLLAALHAFTPREVVFRDRMTVEETVDYLRRRMRWAGFPQAEIDRIDAVSARSYHLLSGGIPRALHAQTLSDFDPGPGTAPTTVPGTSGEWASWMGQPIDDES